MFLDEELEQIVLTKELRTKEDVVALANTLLRCMINRLPDPNEVSPQDLLTEIKKIDNGWKLFCKKHPTLKLNENFWRSHVLHLDVDGKFRQVLGW